MIAAPAFLASTLFLLVAATCASATPRAGEAAVAGEGAWAGTPWRIETALRLDPSRAAADPLLRGSVGVGGEDTVASFRASYRFAPGEILSSTSNRTPRQIARQVVRHDLGLVLDTFASAPLDLRLHSETREAWTLDGHSRERRYGADLTWASDAVRVDLHWSGPEDAVDAHAALDCAWRGNLTLPGLAAREANAGALRLSGRDCAVLARAPALSTGALRAGTLAVSHVWEGDGRRHEVAVQRIAPYVGDPLGGVAADAARADADAAYEIAMAHSRRQAGWEASARAALRDLDSVSAHASIQRDLPLASVKASWVHGADALWFLPPQDRARGDRLDLALDLSRLMRGLAPQLAPQFAVQWKWWRTRAKDRALAGDSLLALQLSIDW